MTYAEFGQRVTATEFDLWLALAQVRAEECPHCGVAPREFMDYGISKIRCPVCRETYHKTNRLEVELGKVRNN